MTGKTRCKSSLQQVLNIPISSNLWTILPGGGSELITHGLTEDEEKMETQRPGHGVRRRCGETHFFAEICRLMVYCIHLHTMMAVDGNFKKYLKKDKHGFAFVSVCSCIQGYDMIEYK